MPDTGYINYFEVLGLDETCKTGDVRKNYKQQMKALVMEIGRVEITPERKDAYLLELARHNAAFYILRDTDLRDHYEKDRRNVIALEVQWGEAVKSDSPDADRLRRQYDAALRHFLSRYLEELMLVAGRDPECVEASRWDPAHERHAGPVLRSFRQQLYQEIQERLPFSEVTEPQIDWEERVRTIADTLSAAGA
ncbi:MAG: hypothetical protein HYV27_17725 [Candidatus Hydrogenedentes bacterium]|nr:hypothetical protein [Candidatus Hydrogenedentota bacterium]